ncbi:MAG: CinA family protein [Thermodesulfobacteriota bacterium]
MTKKTARALCKALKEAHATLAVAESCTGGLLSSMITEVPGCSAYFRGGVVAYANDAKKRLLGVSAATLDRHGAVSAQTATEMAEGARKRLQADVSVSITGIAGPGGGSAAKPVGTVYCAVSSRDGTKVERFLFEGGRKAVRRASALAAIDGLIRLLDTGKD